MRRTWTSPLYLMLTCFVIYQTFVCWAYPWLLLGWDVTRWLLTELKNVLPIGSSVCMCPSSHTTACPLWMFSFRAVVSELVLGSISGITNRFSFADSISIREELDEWGNKHEICFVLFSRGHLEFGCLCVIGWFDWSQFWFPVFSRLLEWILLILYGP